MNKMILALMGVAVILPLTGCLEDERKPQVPSVKAEQERKAVAALESIQFTDNSEIDNIKRRLELTSKPGIVGYIILLNSAGQPIMYEGVRGKITSGNKRLSPPDKVEGRNIGGNNGGVAYSVRQAGSDEGTFGSSAPYIFYWNTDGAYRQWSGDYLYSDQPLRLRVEPLVVNITDGKK